MYCEKSRVAKDMDEEGCPSRPEFFHTINFGYIYDIIYQVYQ